MRKVLARLLLATVGLLVLAGCGPRPPETVEITLTDFGVESPVTSFGVGQPYRFVITNEGAINHEFVIMRPLTEDDMAMGRHGNMEEALLEVAEEELPPGATVTVEYTFTEPMGAGSLEFACHVEGHYEAGMRMPMTVER